jgi:hypothetical protein
MYRLVNHMPVKGGLHPSTGKLFRNDWNDSLKHPVFTDVSKQAGIQLEGYANAICITDINNDGWKDIYVANDFLASDYLWINNKNGTFSERLSDYFKHITANAMGCDMADINNDGLMDLLVLDMNPEDNYRKNTMLQSNKELQYRNLEGYNQQYSRNTLQLNQGCRVGQNDSIGLPIFSEIGFYAGIEATDWSWGPLIADFDNDGNRDIIIANGFPKDVTDFDFGTFRNRFFNVIPKEQMLKRIPEVKLHNYAFRNNSNLSFSDVSEKWGLGTPTYTNGGVYVDLDNDGDLDLVMNNINDKASVYRNNAREYNKDSSHYLQVRLKGDNLNRNGIGAWVEIDYDHGKKQVWENNPYKGYLSTVGDGAHFGLGRILTIDSVIVKWQNGKKQVFQNANADQVLTVDISKANSCYTITHDTLARNTMFKEVTRELNIQFTHQEEVFKDFSIQPGLPHKLSEYGPALASGDIDGNGLDDFICGGSSYQSAQLFLQQKDGRFIQKPLVNNALLKTKQWKDLGILLFDADNDGDLDLYISSGGYEYKSNTAAYQDHFYVNNGKGEFKEYPDAIPQNFGSKFCVRAIDYDKDGDLDLFVAGRVDPGNYPKPVSSFIFRNDTKDGRIKFTDVTNEVAKDLINIGLVTDALFTDFNNDGWMDLVLVGEWMPITFLENQHGIFKNVTASSGISKQVGWWNTIAAGDFDNDGDIDYIVGNLGQNSYYWATEQYPVSVYAGDFNNSGRYDAFLSLFLPVSHQDKTVKEFPAQSRDDVLWQMNSLRQKFPDYKTFATTSMDKFFSAEQMKSALIYRANNFNSCYCRNDGNGKFTLQPLPEQAQISVLNGMVVDDFDGDGNLDVLISGNDYGTEISTGRYDALNGLLLKGNGFGSFIPQTILESGIYLPGNAKALIKLRSKNESYLVAASQNKGPLKVFELKRNVRNIPFQKDDVTTEIKYANGIMQKQECYNGFSFLSQSAGFLTVNNNVSQVIISNSKGLKRKIKL